MVKLVNGKLVWSGLLLGIGTVTLLAAADASSGVVIPAVLASASPLVTAWLAWLLDKERLKIYQRVSAAVVVTGIMLLSVP